MMKLCFFEASHLSRIHYKAAFELNCELLDTRTVINYNNFIPVSSSHLCQSFKTCNDFVCEKLNFSWCRTIFDCCVFCFFCTILDPSRLHTVIWWNAELPFIWNRYLNNYYVLSELNHFLYVQTSYFVMRTSIVNKASNNLLMFKQNYF